PAARASPPRTPASPPACAPRRGQCPLSAAPDRPPPPSHTPGPPAPPPSPTAPAPPPGPEAPHVSSFVSPCRLAEAASSYSTAEIAEHAQRTQSPQRSPRLPSASSAVKPHF